MNRTSSAAIAVTAVLCAATLGARHGPQQPRTALWYALLRKPRYTPPGPAIGATWGVLEVLLVATGYRLLHQPPSSTRDKALGGWVCSLIGLAAFPWLFFKRKRLGMSTAASAAMLAAATGTAAHARTIDTPAAVMTLPLLGWLGFATLLNGDLYRRNS
ncbi:MAG: tryptophan-rich sensory protein [Proteobacteria bacterium]|nr:tryptophan-rich sensory protein [Pseudomonadota bacterium]